jgi:hypothetical protein
MQKVKNDGVADEQRSPSKIIFRISRMIGITSTQVRKLFLHDVFLPVYIQGHNTSKREDT